MPSSSSVKIVSLDREALLAELRRDAAKACAEHPEIETIRLFGSVARGDATGTNDVDLLIVLREMAEADPILRIRIFLPYFNARRAADVLVCTRAELDLRLADGDRFLAQAWNESVPLTP